MFESKIKLQILIAHSKSQSLVVALRLALD